MLEILAPSDTWPISFIPSASGPELAYRLRAAQPTLMDVPIYFWYTITLLYMFVYQIFMTSPLWLTIGPLYKDDYLQIFEFGSFWLHGCCG